MRKSIVAILVACFLLIFTASNVFVVNSQVPNTDSSLFLPILFNNYDPTWQWENKINLTLSPSPASDPQMVIDNLGRTHIFWDTYTSPRFIYHPDSTSPNQTKCET